MQYFLFLVIPVGLFYGYWYFVRKAPAVLGVADTASVKFESVVPLAGEEEIDLLYEEPETMSLPQLLETNESVLLAEADRIMTAVESIAASKEDVLHKLGDLLSGFNLFYNTDYQDAINRFIASVLKRECDITINNEEIVALWV